MKPTGTVVWSASALARSRSRTGSFGNRQSKLKELIPGRCLPGRCVSHNYLFVCECRCSQTVNVHAHRRAHKGHGGLRIAVSVNLADMPVVMVWSSACMLLEVACVQSEHCVASGAKATIIQNTGTRRLNAGSMHRDGR
jgi:hypothetical protein